MVIIKELKDFVDVHGVLLAASGVPPVLYQQLFEKLSSETFDGGSFFQIELCENGKQKRLVLSCDTLLKDSQIFLVDHAWSFRLPDARNQLQEIPELVKRMATLMCVADEFDLEACENVTGECGQVSINEAKENPQDIIDRELCKAREEDRDVLWLELEDLQIDDEMLCSLDLSSKLPNLVGLNLWGNKLETIESVTQTVGGFNQLRALWLNENPVLKHCGTALRNILLDLLPQLEIYNSQFTHNYSQWALGFCAGIYGAEKPVAKEQRVCPLKDVTELDLSNRSIHNLSNKVFNPLELPLLTSLNLRGNLLDQNSAENLLELLHGFINLQSLEVDIPGPLGSSAVKIAETLPNLSSINGVSASKILEEEKVIVESNLEPRLPEWSNGEPLIDLILRAMWIYLMTYRLADEEKLDETPVWYMMDELGSALRHSDVPNFKIAPFLFMPDGKITSAISYSVMWPNNDVHKGEECTRDYLPGIGEDKQRSSRLTSWFHTPEYYFIQMHDQYYHKLHSTAFRHPVRRDSQTQSIRPNDGRSLLVYTDNVQVEEFLNRPEFVLTDDAKKADVVWTGMQIDEEFKKIAGLKDHQYVNQFPFEACIVMKHHLAQTIQQAHGDPQWFQITYNLETQLSELIGDYLVRDKEGQNNLWILKPWNMARTIDTTVTGYLPTIIRLMETGPKICQKYIENPALFKGRKFDLRYIVLLRSVQPLEIFLSDIFWVRLANNQYTLKESSLSDYETHFTVMNYRGQLNHINTDEFVFEFEHEHNERWVGIHEKVRVMIRAVFESASALHPEMHCPTARAIYGVDVMIDSEFQPKLLEVTYCPDCTRACKYDVKAVVGSGEIIKGSEFFNDIFGCLFLNESRHVSQL
uniref:Putative tubulin-tyrosine ligase n=1 Tax=Callitropsis vietnamensis TaxID=257623 RepID=A0A3Q8CFY9_9CONI|nr:putative tubulin-tyrosine ligase [Callitropsis vietnamensis]